MVTQVFFFLIRIALSFSFSVSTHASDRYSSYGQEVLIHEQNNLGLGAQFFSKRQVLQSPPTQSHPAFPYSAEELGMRAIEFPHTPLWNCLLIDIGTTVTPDGFLDQQVATSAILALPQPDSPGQEAFRWISQSVNSQNPEDTAIVQVGYHTGKNTDVALTTFFPRPSLPPLRSSISRGERLPTGVGTIEDVVGRNAWAFSWRILGSDILERTIRFPVTQKQFVVPDTKGKAVAIPTQTVKIMGEDYRLHRYRCRAVLCRGSRATS